MKKLCFLLLLIFFVFSCKSTPKKDSAADNSGSSQIELTTDNKNDDPGVGFDDEPQTDETAANEDALTQDNIADNSETAEKPAEEKIEEKPVVVEAKDEVKEVPKPEEIKPPAPPETKPQPPVAVTKTEPPPADAKPDDSADDKKDDQSDNAPPPPPVRRPPLTPPPTVTAIQDDAPIPNRQALVPPKDEDIVFTRIVNAFVGQLVEIPFRGTGWVYLGEIASKRGLPYNSRRFDIEGQSIIFTAEEAGTYGLKFFKHDVIRDYILNDYVQVIVSESPNRNGSPGWFNPPVDRGRVTAEPRWPSVLEEEAMLRGGPRTPASGSQPAAQAAAGNRNGASAAQSAAQQGANNAPPASASQAQGTPAAVTPQAVTQTPQTTPAQSAPTQPAATQPAGTPTTTATQPAGTTPAGTTPAGTTPAGTTAPTTVTQPAEMPPAEKQEILPPEEILKRAQDAFNGGKAAEAIALLDQYNEFYPGGNDELYWFYGQFYEANTPSRNILLSLDYYRRLVDEYPQSKRYNDARRRISYLERFYINIQ